MDNVEKNPLKIIWLTRSKLLPSSVWVIWILMSFGMFICTFVIPDQYIKMNFSAFNIEKFMPICISALAFVLAMYTFGKDVYTNEDLVVLLKTNELMYYGFLADYLFAGLNWGVIILFSTLRIMLIISLPMWILNFLRVLYLSELGLATIATISIVIKNINRGTNKIVLLRAAQEKAEAIKKLNSK